MLLDIQIEAISPSHYEKIIKLSDDIFGRGYLNMETLLESIKKSNSKGLQNAFSILSGNKFLGFAIAFAPGKWEAKKEGYTLDQWPGGIERASYFEKIVISPRHTKKGIGSVLLQELKETAKRQGALFGVAHSWLQSQKKSSLNFAEANGSRTIKIWQRYWKKDSEEKGWNCFHCGNPCLCDAAEIIFQL